jgi:hypothetical protein
VAIIVDPLTIRLAIEGLSQPTIDSESASETAPELALTRRCIGDGRLRMNVVGDEDAVRDANFKLDKRLVRRDTEAQFEQVLARRTLARTRATRVRAIAYLRPPCGWRLEWARGGGRER